MSGSAAAKVAVVGAGIAGSALAYRLSLAGVGTLLIEASEAGSAGASGVAAALLNPYRGRSARPGPYDLEGLEGTWRLADELLAAGLDPGTRRSGVLRIASSARQAKSWGSQQGLVAQAQLPPGYRAPYGAFLAESGGWLQPALLLKALELAAVAQGAKVLRGQLVARVERQRGSWRLTGPGFEGHFAQVVLCLGADSIAGVELPAMERIAGDLVALRSPLTLPLPLAGATYLASLPGRAFVGGNHRPAGASDVDAPRLLRASAARMVPDLTDAPVEAVWTGVRARPPRHLPLSLELEPGLWFLGGFGGRGFLTAPLLAERLATELVSGSG